MHHTQICAADVNGIELTLLVSRLNTSLRASRDVRVTYPVGRVVTHVGSIFRDDPFSFCKPLFICVSKSFTSSIAVESAMEKSHSCYNHRHTRTNKDYSSPCDTTRSNKTKAVLCMRRYKWRDCLRVGCRCIYLCQAASPFLGACWELGKPGPHGYCTYAKASCNFRNSRSFVRLLAFSHSRRPIRSC